MKGITVKLPDETLARLRAEAEAAGMSLAELIRLRITSPRGGATFGEVARDLIGSVKGSGRSATNARRKFRR